MKHHYIKYLPLIIPVGILLLFMTQYLSLPLFYDEAWSYFPAIRRMAEIGPTLLPGKLGIDDCKGHPQLFYFTVSAWINIFSSNILTMRILPLIISISVLVVLYIGLLHISNWVTGLAASLLVSVQAVFMAQSAMLLPEMMMTLWFVLSLLFFIRKKFVAYALFSSLMVLTKETAIIFALAFGVSYLISLSKADGRRDFKYLHLLALAMPGLIYAGFLLMHYTHYQTFLYNEHVNYLTFNKADSIEKLSRAISFIFVRYGRSCLTAAFIILLIYSALRRATDWRFVLTGTICLIMFSVFSMFNFYTHRYELVSIVIFIIMLSSLLGQLKASIFLKISTIITLTSIGLYYTATKKENADIDLGYVESTKIMEDMVHYCEKQGWHNESFSVSFNLIFALRDKDLGYIKENREFSKVSDCNQYREARFFMYESTDQHPPGIEYVKAHFRLVKSFTNKHAWGYIYENADKAEK